MFTVGAVCWTCWQTCSGVAWRSARLVLDNWTAGGDMALKLVYTRGVEGGDGTPTGFALGMEIADKVIQQRQDGVAAITLERGIEPGLAARAPWLLLGAKSLSYAINMAAGREAQRRGAQEVIFTASDGSVLEGPTSTVVTATGSVLRTPPAAIGILPGTTQAALFRAAERAGWSVKVEPLPVADLFTADAVVFASSVRSGEGRRGASPAPPATARRPVPPPARRTSRPVARAVPARAEPGASRAGRVRPRRPVARSAHPATAPVRAAAAAGRSRTAHR